MRCSGVAVCVGVGISSIGGVCCMIYDPRCCSVLRCVAVCCKAEQCVAVCCSVLQCVVDALYDI